MQDLTFITNEPGQTLKDRFEVLIKDSRFFDVLVGYFYIAGFYKLYKALENTERIRILIGISTNPETYEATKIGRDIFSHKEVKDEASKIVQREMENSPDDYSVEEGVKKFINWINNGKLKIGVYPS